MSVEHGKNQQGEDKEMNLQEALSKHVKREKPKAQDKGEKAGKKDAGK